MMAILLVVMVEELTEALSKQTGNDQLQDHHVEKFVVMGYKIIHFLKPQPKELILVKIVITHYQEIICNQLLKIHIVSVELTDCTITQEVLESNLVSSLAIMMRKHSLYRAQPICQEMLLESPVPLKLNIEFQFVNQCTQQAKNSVILG